MAVTRSSYGGNSSTRSCSGAESSAGEPSARPLLSSWPILLYLASFFWRCAPFTPAGASSSPTILCRDGGRARAVRAQICTMTVVTVGACSL
jgi:hypothetical protein